MKILIYRYGSIFEPDVIEAFSGLGINCEEIKEEITNKDIKQSERIDLVSKAVLSNIDAGTPYLFVFSINFYPDISALCEKLRIKYVCWSVDCPVLELFSKEIKNSYNRIFLFDRHQYQWVSKYNPEGAFHLPLASGVGRIDKVIEGITSEDKVRFSSDITFVGSLYSEKNIYNELKDMNSFAKGYLDGIIEAQLGVYGANIMESALTDEVVAEAGKYMAKYNSEGLVEPIERFLLANRYMGYELAYRERVRTLNALGQHFNVDLYTLSDTSPLKGVNNKGQAKTLSQMPKIFRLSKINLNMTMRPIETGLPLRIFDILSSGGFCMTNFQEELLDMFTIGEDIEAYSSLDELIDKCRYYLANEDVRAEVARKGYEKVKNIHNIQNSVVNIIQNLQDSN